jgi:hypothetical protein
MLSFAIYVNFKEKEEALTIILTPETTQEAQKDIQEYRSKGFRVLYITYHGTPTSLNQLQAVDERQGNQTKNQFIIILEK